MSTIELAKSFHNMCLKLIEHATQAWPEDPFLPFASVAFNTLEAEVSVRLFEEHFGVYLGGLINKDVSVLNSMSKHPALEALDIETKFARAEPAVQEKLWELITNICKFISMNRLYKHIPSDVLGAVTSAAHDLKSKLDSGEIDPKSINPYEIGKDVMGKFSSGELDSMMKNFMTNPEVMETIMAQMKTMMEPSGNVDLADMMKLMGASKDLD